MTRRFGRLRGVVCSLLVCGALSACATDEAVLQEEVLAPDPRQPVLYPVDDYAAYGLSSAQEAEGDVQIFGFDPFPPEQTEPVPSAEPGLTSLPSGYEDRNIPSADSSVTVYSIDAEMSRPAYAIQPPESIRPQMMPPSSAQPSFPSPFDARGNLTPLPEGARSVSSQNDGDGEKTHSFFFGHDAVTLSPSGMRDLSRLGKGYAAQIDPVADLVLVEGHASARASEKDPVKRRIINLRTSMNRALHVSSRLMQAGVPAESIETTAWGDTRPAKPQPGRSEESLNRRVDVSLERLDFSRIGAP